MNPVPALFPVRAFVLGLFFYMKMKLSRKERKLLRSAYHAEMVNDLIQFEYGKQNQLGGFEKEWGAAFRSLMEKGLVEGDICFGGFVKATHKGKYVVGLLKESKVIFNETGWFIALETYTKKQNRKAYILTALGVVIGILGILVSIFLSKG